MKKQPQKKPASGYIDLPQNVRGLSYNQVWGEDRPQGAEVLATPKGQAPSTSPRDRKNTEKRKEGSVTMNIRRQLVVIVAIFAAAGVLVAVDCPPTVTVDVNDYQIDPNKVNFKLLCVIEAVAGEQLDKELIACDPDDDNGGFVFTLAGEPAGMLAIMIGGGGTPGAWSIVWRAAEGVYYVDVTVTDMPVGDGPLSDRGTIVFIVYRKNRPPVLGGCR